MEGLSKPVAVRTLFDDHSRKSADVPTEKALDGRARIWMCAGFFVLVFAAMIGRLGYITFGMDEEIRIMRAEKTVPFRPEVVDRNGRPLIMNRKATGLAVDGRDVWDVEEVVAGLETMFPSIDSERLRSRLSDKKYALVLESILPEEQQAVVALGLPGIRFPDTTARAYPQRDLASHLVGYTIPGKGGAIGVEKALERTLETGPEGTVRLSIDLVAQQVLEDELALAMQTYSAAAAWGVLMDVHTGEVRAMASLPDFNPNQPGAAEGSAWRNRVMSDVYELGSAFKPLTIAAALQSEVVTLNETFDVRRPVEVDGWTIKDYSWHKGDMTAGEIVQYSSNIGTIQIVQRLGVEGFTRMLDDLNLSEPVETELPEAGRPRLSKEWRPSELATSSYGQGISVSPLALTAAFSAVVNGGEYHHPTFLADKKTLMHSVFSDTVSAQMRIVLRKTITEGTGSKAEVPGYYPIGKTSTADKPGKGGYQDRGYVTSSFIGAFPGYDPQYVLLVSLDEPQGTKETRYYATAGHVAAPIFRRVVERAAPALGLMPVGDDVAFDGFVGLRREPGNVQPAEQDALAALLVETVN